MYIHISKNASDLVPQTHDPDSFRHAILRTGATGSTRGNVFPISYQVLTLVFTKVGPPTSDGCVRLKFYLGAVPSITLNAFFCISRTAMIGLKDS